MAIWLAPRRLHTAVVIAVSVTLSCSKAPDPSVTAPANGPTPPTQPAAACQYEVTPVERIALPLAETASFSIDTPAGCPWRIENVPDWVTVKAARNGTGSATITYDIAPHPGAVSNVLREAPVEVRWDAPTAGQNVWVRQMPRCAMLVYDPVAKTNIQTYRIGAAGGRVALWTLVDSPFSCQWSARSETDWISFHYPKFPEISRGDGGIAFEVTPNLTGAERTGRVQVAEVYLTVIQSDR
jgi:hypothetical protein